MRRALALLVALTVLGLPAVAAAANCPRTTLGDVEDEVMCQVCGTPLALATEAPQAQRERAFIQRLIDRCRSKAQVKRALAAEYGDDVLALPGGDGFDLAAYLVPGLALLAAGVALGVAASRWRRGRWRRWPNYPPDDPGDPAGSREPRRPLPPSDSDSKQLDADIERYDL